MAWSSARGDDPSAVTRTAGAGQGEVAGPGRPLGEVYAVMPLTAAQVRAGMVLGVAFVIEAWEMLALIYISGDVQSDLGVSQAQVSLLVSVLFLGMIPGSLLAGRLIDRLGRRRVCIGSLATYGVLTLLSALAPGYSTLLVGRLLAGVALASLQAVLIPYFEELLPVRVRGRATVYLSSGWALGTLLAVGCAAALGTHGWRVVVGVTALAGLWSLAVARWVPESPYWLAARDRQEAARHSLRRLGAVVDDETRLYVRPGQAGSLAALFAGRLRAVTAVALVINVLFSWGYWGFASGLPQLLADQGLSLPATLGFGAVGALIMVPGYLSASWLTQRYGRRRTLAGYLAAAALGGFVFAGAQSETMLYAGNAILSFFVLGAFGVWNTWLGELYPTSARAAGFAFGIFAQRISNAVAPVSFTMMLGASLPFEAIVAAIGAALLVPALLSLRLPETEGAVLT